MDWYGNWLAVITSVVLFTFILAFVTPIKKKNWRSFGIYEAFIVSLFTEMYGIPLTIYVLSSFFGLPLTANHSQGHLIAALLAIAGVWDLEMGVTIVMAISTVMLFMAGYLVIAGWRQVYGKKEKLVSDGIYSIIRHPQYLGLIIVVTALLIQWPTIITAAMWPILTFAYYRQAKKEEKDLKKRFGKEYYQYRQRVPMLIPRFHSLLGVRIQKEDMDRNLS